VAPQLEPRPSRAALKVTDQVRAIATSLPQVNERLSHGEATWFISDKKSFAAMRDHHHDSRVSVVLAAGEGVQGALVAASPERYFVPPYVGPRGWLGVYLDGTGEGAPLWDEIAQLIRDAWILIAPAKLHSLLND
jgi:hypothetical protein